MVSSAYGVRCRKMGEGSVLRQPVRLIPCRLVLWIWAGLCSFGLGLVQFVDISCTVSVWRRGIFGRVRLSLLASIDQSPSRLLPVGVWSVS